MDVLYLHRNSIDASMGILQGGCNLHNNNDVIQIALFTLNPDG